MSERLTPFQVLQRLIGPVPLIADICGTSEKAPFHWRGGSKNHDADDVPSAKHMRRLLAHSDAHGLGLTAEHLIRGATRAEVDAILAAREAATPQPVAAE
jgi:hypothetical protein